MARRFLGRRLASVILVAAAWLTPAAAAEPVDVVASFSILGDLVAEVGGDHAAVTILVGPDSDAHVYEPSPADARAVAGADLFVVNGLGYEGWLERLIAASGFAGRIVVASRGIEALSANGDHHQAEATPAPGDIDPHAWQSLGNAEIYVENIADALCAVQTAECPAFRANAARYGEALRGLDAAIKADFAAIRPERRKVITTHDAFGYLGRAYGIAFLAPQGVSTESEASAGTVARLIEQIRAEGVTALFLENISDPRLAEQIGRETRVELGGALYSDALSEPGGPASTYLDMMRHNAMLLRDAMRGD